jgi:hypothetical protein
MLLQKLIGQHPNFGPAMNDHIRFYSFISHPRILVQVDCVKLIRVAPNSPADNFSDLVKPIYGSINKKNTI